MEITPMTMYWLTRLDPICHFLRETYILAAIVAFISGFFCVVALPDILLGGTDEFVKKVISVSKRVLRWSIFALFASLTCYALLPNTKEMAAIVVIPKIVNNPDTRQISGDLLDLAKTYLEELKEGRKKK